MSLTGVPETTTPDPIAGQHYRIITNRPQAGLFSSFIQVLGELHYCKRYGVIPLVFFGSNWVYWQRGGYNNAVNGWEYYFAPVSGVRIDALIGKAEEYLENCNIFDFQAERIIPNRNPEHRYDLSRQGHIKLPANVTVVNQWPDFHLGTRSFLERNRIPASEMISEYIRIHPAILAKTAQYYSRCMEGNNIIGVHIRGTEHRREIEDWHGLNLAAERQYIDAVDACLERNPDARLFLATDTESTLEHFRNYYGDRCLYYPARRSSGGNSPHKEFGGAEVGEEMLIEALLLAKTDFLIHGISNVAFAVLAFAPGLPHLDIYNREPATLKAHSAGTGTKKTTVTVAAVAENKEPMLREAGWLFHSLRKFGGRLADARGRLYVVDSLPEDTKHLEALGVEIKCVPAIEPRSPHCNKIRMLLDDHATDWLVALDTDTVITGDFSDYLSEPVLAAKIVDQNPLPEELWERLYACFGRSLPRERHLEHFYGRESNPYFNTGVLLIPGNQRAALGAAWLQHVPGVLDIYPREPEIARHAFFTDQFAFALALAETGLACRALPLEMNFPTHIPVHPQFVSGDTRPLILHHHHRITPEGALAYCGYPEVNRLIDRFNQSL